MPLFTSDDRDAIKTALITAATEGVASVSIGGQAVQTYTLEQLQKLLQAVQADLASPTTGFGMRMVKTVPPGAG
jgi:hypothetical protein